MLRRHDRARSLARSFVLAAALAPLAWAGVARAQQQPPAGTTTQPPPGAPSGPVPNPTPNPAGDTQDLVKQGQQRPADGGVPTRPTDVFSDDWFGRARPIFEIHGYFRTRAELFHNFFLGRHDNPGSGSHLWPQPLDQSYTDTGGQAHNTALCGPLGNQPCQQPRFAHARRPVYHHR